MSKGVKEERIGLSKLQREDAINNSGITTIRFFILLKMDKIEEKTAGGIIINTSNIEREQGAVQTGRIVAMGPAAFETAPGDLKKEWDIAPAHGDQVMIGKYKGHQFDGLDGYKYRLIHDKDIVAIIND